MPRHTFVDQSSERDAPIRNLSLLLPALLLCGCISTPAPLTERNAQLTQGNVQLSIQVGRTTKADILERFGAPNVTARDGSGKEVWTYQRSGQVSQSSSNFGYWNVFLFGQSGESSGFESSSRMITLIIKFDKNDTVSDFKSRSSNF